MRIELIGGPRDGAIIEIPDDPAPVTARREVLNGRLTYVVDRKTGKATYVDESAD